MSGFGDVVTREITWLTTDPCPTFVTAPPQLLHRTRTLTDGVTYTSSLVASSATAAFTSADIGSRLTTTNFPASSTIVTVTNASSVILSASSTASSTAQSFEIDNLAPLDGVQAYWKKVPAGRQRWLFLTCEGEKRDDLYEMHFSSEIVYNMLATVRWGFAASSGQLEEEQQNLHDAVNSVLLRLRGTQGDHTHNGQFQAAAAGGPEGDGNISVRLQNAYSQLTAGEPLIAEIRYTVSDHVVIGT